MALALTFSAGGDGSGGMLIWPLFGTTNQLMAALSLAIITVILTRLRRPTWPVLIPLVFVMTVSLWAAIVQVRGFWDTQNWLLLVIDLIIIVCAVWVTVEAFAAMNRARNEEPVVWTDEDTDAPAPVVAAKKL